MKTPYMVFVKHIYDRIIKREIPKEYVMIADTYEAMFCSDGKPTESSYCKRMIGYAISRRWIATARMGYGQHDKKLLEDVQFNSYTDKFEYFALYTNHRAEKPEITRLPLGHYRELNEARATYDALFKGDKPKATVGVFLNTRYGNYMERPKTHMKARQAQMDCWEMVTEYL